MKKPKGFTLVELMVVLTVIALLLSVVVPEYIGRLRRADDAKRFDLGAGAAAGHAQRQRLRREERCERL